jgi:hypothetical protein
MDLVTLIAACALGVEPKSPPSGLDRSIMHALIFEQSGGEPWSFSVPGEGSARVLPTLKDAIREAQAVQLSRGNIHIGLAGLPMEPQSASALMFAPCPNITLAAGEIIQLIERCKAASKPDPIYCAVAAYHGSWEGNGLTRGSPTLSWRRSRKATHPTSTCQKMQISTPMTLLPTQRQLINAQHSRRRS